MYRTIAISAGAAVLVAGLIAGLQSPAVRSVEEKVLREYAGVYQWEPDAFVYLQMWDEFSGTSKLGAFDESGEIRALYPTDHDRFFAGPGMALSTSVESRVEFQRDAAGTITSLSWHRAGSPGRTARRVDIERHEDVRFSNGNIALAGTLIRPNTSGKHPAIILVHASGAADRQQILPLARFLVRRGIAVLGYDKRGVGGSTGDWKTASFDDLAGDVGAAFEFLRTRDDIDGSQIGLLGWSQAGWIMPLAATRVEGLAFLISISGAGVPVAETTLDQTQNELTARGMKPQTIAEIVSLMKLQYHFARTGEGWDAYVAAREKLASRIGPAPETFPGTPNHPHWEFIRRLYFYDPAPVLRQLQVPTLALFGELDNNIVAQKNKAAWEAALTAGRHSDYTLLIVPKANHLLLEAKIGSNEEMPSLQRVVPTYYTTVHGWLAKRIRGVSRTEPSPRIGAR